MVVQENFGDYTFNNLIIWDENSKWHYIAQKKLSDTSTPSESNDYKVT